MSATARPLWRHHTGNHDALGHHFGVRTNDDVVGRHLAKVLAPLAATGDPQEWYDILVSGGRAQVWWRGEVMFDGALGLLVPALHGHVNRSAVTATAGIALHAAAASRGGATVLLPAPAESGKSTLVAGLVLAGWSYFTDEVSAIDPATGSVRAYPKAISVDRGSWGVVPALEPHLDPATALLRGDQWQVPAENAPATSSLSPPVQLIAFPAYETDAETRLEPLTPAEAVVLLGANSFNLMTLGDAGLDQLAALAQGARCFRLPVGDLADAVELLHGAVANRAAERSEAQA